MAVSLKGCPTSLTSSTRPHYLPTKLELTTVPICVQSSPVLKRLCAALESVRTEQVMLNTPGVLATAVAETAMMRANKRDAKAAETAKAKGGGTDWLANTMADNLLPVQVAEPH